MKKAEYEISYVEPPFDEPALIRRLLECGGEGGKRARHRFGIRETVSADRKRRRRSPLLPPNSAAALHKADRWRQRLFGSWGQLTPGHFRFGDGGWRRQYGGVAIP